MPAKYAFEPVIAGTWGNEDKNDENDVICYRAADFDYEHLKVNESAGVVRNIAPSELVVKTLHPDDILIEKSGGGEKTLVGRSVLFDSDKVAVCSNFVSVLRPKSGQSSRYWNYQLAALYSNRGTEPFIKQSTGIQNLDVKAYLSQHVPIRSFEEQERIADELDRELAEIDELIADVVKLQKLIEEREIAELEKNLIENATEFVELRRLKPKCISGTSVNAAPWQAGDSEFGVLKTGVVSKGYFDPSQNKAVIEESEISRLSVSVKANTIIVNRANSPELVGSSAYVNRNFSNLFLSDKLWQIDFEDADNALIAAIMQTRFFKEQVRQLCVGTSSSMQNISYQDFISIKIPLSINAEKNISKKIFEDFLITDILKNKKFSLLHTKLHL